MPGKNANETNMIALPSLIHRMGGETVKQAKQIAENHQCRLKRVRRSRNWQLEGKSESITSLLLFLRSEHPESMRYLIDKVSAYQAIHAKPKLSVHEQLLQLVGDNPSITLSEMMSVTHCSVAQARTARFEAEEIDD